MEREDESQAAGYDHPEDQEPTGSFDGSEPGSPLPEPAAASASPVGPSTLAAVPTAKQFDDSTTEETRILSSVGLLHFDWLPPNRIIAHYHKIDLTLITCSLPKTLPDTPII
ncbi:hypothetical protein ROHU_003340 [Labeo rohita]|uniref:Uncharacterized protein n=1 Tax=Labeo rohita TaxID=84645 RepID=A0A498NVJ9_LABRO|nr:hypothetical protein ROHU_003340 [Labeo rohita]